jgi:GNAT superfamily N-acetyltransferase
VASIRIIDVDDEAAFRLIPPCADPGFDHRTCDYWEDAERGSRAARLDWLAGPPAARPRPSLVDNPFAPPPAGGPARNPFLVGDEDDAPPDNPFAPQRAVVRPRTSGVPRKFALLDRGRGVFGTYAKVLLRDDTPAAYVQFGPLSAYPRAGRLRDLYPQLPLSPLPAVISCIATTAAARRAGLAARLAAAVCDDLARRGFAAVEAYPDLTRDEDHGSGATPAFWQRLGFTMAVPDARFPVMRREL